ncbi:phosphoribosylaminoimidazolesuccinocarboxamide synthase [Candidatus Thorarchaeota archaeon]|nr:MAG: phosphoribosylaminoimidazolesuccinocarboxamide synthase [Candidatus Thorarchaeota archaeon]
MDLINEGKVKRVYADPESPKRVIIEFTDTITAGDGQKREEIEGKGLVTCDTSEFLLKYLQDKGVATHFIKRLEETRLLCRKVDIFPLEVVCRNFAAGSFCDRYGLKRGQLMSEPLIEFFLKDDSLHDPLLSADAIERLGIANPDEIAFMYSVTLSVNYYLRELLSQAGLRFVDFKLEFGKAEDGAILLADEISGDTIRVWDKDEDSLDKDIFRHDSGNVVEAYGRLLGRLKETNPDEIPVRTEFLTILVLPKDGIKNPPGEVTRKAMTRLGFEEVVEVRAGRIYRVKINRPISPDILNQLHEMNMKLLSNPIAEKTEVRLT